MRKILMLVTMLITLFIVVPVYASQALCFNCGDLHFGALNACDKCGFQPDVENFTLWTTFSDHFMSPPMLKFFGNNMKQIANETPDFEERIWVFFQYIKDSYPGMGIIDSTSFKLPSQYKDRVPQLLEKLKLPVMDFSKSIR